MAQKRITKKSFRELLNADCAGTKYRNHQFAQRTRPYGDYLYAQDRGKFDWYFAVFVEVGGDYQEYLKRV